MTTRILVVEDEPMVSDVVERYLRRDGFDVVTARDGEAAVRMAQQHEPDLVILDLMLPKMDGMEVYRTLRDRGPLPVIFLTARGEETDRIVGLEMGADDYVSKPFSPRELVARVRAVLRRAGQSAPPSSGPEITAGGVTIDPAGRRVIVDWRDVDLTAKEFDLLWFLAGRRGQVFSRDQILDHVWDYDYYGDSSTVTVHIRRLRAKIEADPARPRYLKTVWGVGYKFEA